MRKLLIVLLTGLLATAAYAGPKEDCEAKATEQKLEGKAKTKYVAKCVKQEKMAKQASFKAAVAKKNKCMAEAKKNKLSGKKKETFMKECTGNSK